MKPLFLFNARSKRPKRISNYEKGWGGEEEDAEGAERGEDAAGGASGTSQAEQAQSDGDGGTGYSQRDGAMENSNDTKGESNPDEVPNPFKNPGDASKFWHRKLKVVVSFPYAYASLEGP